MNENSTATNEQLTLLLRGSVIQKERALIVVVDFVDKRNRVVDSTELEAPIDAKSSLPQSLANKVAEILHAQLVEVPGVRELYIRGRGYLNRYDRIENVQLATGAFEKALSKDSTYILAHAGRAEAYLRRYRLTRDPA